jgi:hypothetical protein
LPQDRRYFLDFSKLLVLSTGSEIDISKNTVIARGSEIAFPNIFAAGTVLDCLKMRYEFSEDFLVVTGK